MSSEVKHARPVSSVAKRFTETFDFRGHDHVDADI